MELAPDVLAEATNGSVTVTANQVQGDRRSAPTSLPASEAIQLTGGTGANKFDTKQFTGPVTLLGGDGNDTLLAVVETTACPDKEERCPFGGRWS